MKLIVPVVVSMLALPLQVAAQAAPAAQASQGQWLPVEAAAVKPLAPAEAALWPEGITAAEPAPTRSLGLLLRLLQPKHDGAEEFQLPVANAASLRRRVADAVKQATPTAFSREANGGFVTLASGDGVADALADTISTALLKAGLALRLAAASRWADDTKGLLRALHDPQALAEAQKLATRDSELAKVDAVRVVEAGTQPAALWLSVRVSAGQPVEASAPSAAETPRKLIARVNLDDVLSRVARPAP